MNAPAPDPAPETPPASAKTPPASAETPAVSAEPKLRPRTIDRRMLDEIFGDVLPDTTSDERGGSADGGYSEQWYRDNRPPHHG
ncbi:hypothetical protein [Nakamurella panacisegetis]|uniref:hypothetical protein n=1 Tax=Nakamurella panacisegetis TaxID=1090615 RepID=UPI0012FDF063|nr:hypothetical protein [Nakamurella panacisegetis]